MSADAQFALDQAAELLQIFYSLRKEGTETEGVDPAIRFIEQDSESLRRHRDDPEAEATRQMLLDPTGIRTMDPIARLLLTCQTLRQKWALRRPDMFTTSRGKH